MRMSLVFPPRTSPTYQPLGAACLVAVGQRGNHEVDFFDANLDLWNLLCDEDIRLYSMRSFSHGDLATFRNPELYTKHWDFMPLGLGKIEELEKLARQYLSGNGLDMKLEKLLIRQSRRIESSTPELVGFSLMYTDQLPFALALAKYLTEIKSGCRVIFGGAAMSAVSPELLLSAAPFIEAILVGEGEVLFEMLLNGTKIFDLPGCWFRDAENKIKVNKTSIEEVNLITLPNPEFNMTLGYFNPVPVLPIYGCRGCKWRRCRFCTHNRSFGRYRMRPPMMTALEMLKRQEQNQCHNFYMVDQYVDPEYLSALSDALLKIGADCRFQIMARTVADYTPQLLEKAARAGCCWISWGMESGSQRMLNIMNKGTQIESSRQVIHAAAAVGISNLLMMIFGAPGEDRESMEDTFAFLEKSWNDIDGMTASAFVLFEHTAFGNNPDKYGLEILGGNPIININGQLLSDQKLRFRRTGESGRFESPLASEIIAQWERRKVWLPELPFHGRLCCEHYLLYAASPDVDSSSPGPNLRSA